MLRLKGQTGLGEWVEFDCCSTSIHSMDERHWLVFDNRNTGVLRRIVAATIQPADDPRKAMLDEILSEVQSIDILGKIQTSRLTSFLLKMEAKL